jgi:hypothetical protein
MIEQQKYNFPTFFQDSEMCEICTLVELFGISAKREFDLRC